jgi:aminodeoxyfutalosine synthase
VAIAVDTGLEPIREKVEANERLCFADGVALLASDDLLALGELADLARRVRGGDDRVSFVQSLSLNQTIDTETDTGELIATAARQHQLAGFTELHLTSGENPHVGFDAYRNTVARLHQALPDVHLKLSSASEIHRLATLSGFEHEEVLRELKAAGLGSLTGGDAEIVAEAWLQVHATAHRLGIPTHCALRYGHVETPEEQIDRLLRLRDQQDATGGFLAFVPLAFDPENTVVERRGFTFQPGAADLKMLAVSRLVLDNFENIEANWASLTMPVAQVALHFGANDLQGTVICEEIVEAAGSRAGMQQTIDDVVRVVRAAGRVPVQRDTLYNELRRFDDE